MTYDRYKLTITISDVETSNLDQLEILCEMMAEVCESMVRKCDYDTVNRFSLAEYDLEKMKEDEE